MSASRYLLEIDGRKYALRSELSHAQLADLLVILEGMMQAEEAWTPDYVQRRAVTDATASAVGVSLLPEARVCTQEQFRALCEKHPKKEGQP